MMICNILIVKRIHAHMCFYIIIFHTFFAFSLFFASFLLFFTLSVIFFNYFGNTFLFACAPLCLTFIFKLVPPVAFLLNSPFCLFYSFVTLPNHGYVLTLADDGLLKFPSQIMTCMFFVYGDFYKILLFIM